MTIGIGSSFATRYGDTGGGIGRGPVKRVEGALVGVQGGFPIGGPLDGRRHPRNIPLVGVVMLVAIPHHPTQPQPCGQEQYGEEGQGGVFGHNGRRGAGHSMVICPNYHRIANGWVSLQLKQAKIRHELHEFFQTHHKTHPLPVWLTKKAETGAVSAF